ncbi:MAG: hypothetical protein M9928_15615 [Anaerolineae bacterium]|nr:hypothetical protein [Anaerolineae bacterium]MCO5194559.1 hypothetical protein [Anaerolineae bacterium]MCO5199632.1 hypothetical protein [Anaerolineae bacterium]MCO5206464.1 hypothetical protein [Anaerolineae bacterium]
MFELDIDDSSVANLAAQQMMLNRLIDDLAGGKLATAILAQAVQIFREPLDAAMPVDTGTSKHAQFAEIGGDSARIYTEPSARNPKHNLSPVKYLPDWFAWSGRALTPWEEAVHVGTPALPEAIAPLIEAYLR